MLLSTQLQYGDDPINNAEAVVGLEKAGLDVVWVAEAYSYDAVSLMGYLAARTERVQIGSGILPIYSRTPTLTAMTAAGLDALSGGRTILGLGASGPQVIEGFHGVPYDKPVARTREIIEICRQVWRRERIQHEGLYSIPLPPGQGTGLGKPLKLINHPKRADIPIWVAALGDKNLEMTAELAHGWLPHAVLPEKMDEVFGPALRAGSPSAPPSSARCRSPAAGCWRWSRRCGSPRGSSRGACTRSTSAAWGRAAELLQHRVPAAGLRDEAKLVQDLYLDGKKEEAAAALPDDFIDRVTLIGEPGFVKERIAALRSVGVTHLHVNPVTADARSCCRR
jgi:alkanesulfonate monooxygenase SsuD/methylene tetrahydromethanopterin reductase-like flavin-dependent oxidoreductase (luciferase family)